jgi:hypothetical protein
MTKKKRNWSWIIPIFFIVGFIGVIYSVPPQPESASMPLRCQANPCPIFTVATPEHLYFNMTCMDEGYRLNDTEGRITLSNWKIDEHLDYKVIYKEVIDVDFPDEIHNKSLDCKLRYYHTFWEYDLVLTLANETISRETRTCKPQINFEHCEGSSFECYQRTIYYIFRECTEVTP